jgi:hypothetical protein
MAEDTQWVVEAMAEDTQWVEAMVEAMEDTLQLVSWPASCVAFCLRLPITFFLYTVPLFILFIALFGPFCIPVILPPHHPTPPSKNYSKTTFIDFLL